MSDVISFECTGCGTPYRVAASYAGREFNCKQCGTHLCVPVPGHSAGVNIAEPDVELDSGGEVMRRTASGRQVPTDPTRVFAARRSDRLSAVQASGERPAKSSKGMLIGVVLLVLLLGAGVGIAYAAGLFGKPAESANQQPTAKADTPAVKQETEREKILKQLDVSGQKASEFMDLFKRGEAAKLDAGDLAQIAHRMVAALDDELGAGYSDADLMALAKRMTELDSQPDARTLYMLVIRRNRSKAKKSDEYAQAHKLMGDTLLDFNKQITRATELSDSGVVDGMAKLHDELLEMETRAEDGWAVPSDKARFDEISKALDEGEAELERIKKEDPFRLIAHKAETSFRLEKISTYGKWVTIRRAPYVFFVQQQDGEDQDATRARLQTALDAAASFPEFFKTTLAEPLGLKRMLPSGLSAEERKQAPFVVLLFRSDQYMAAYLRERDAGNLGVSKINSFTEPGSGRASMVYDTRATSQAKFQRMLLDAAIYNFHPRAPKTKAEDDKFRAFNSYWLTRIFGPVVSYTGRSGNDGFFYNNTGLRETLKRYAQPFAVDETRRSITSFGGPAFTVKQMVSLAKFDDAAALMRANFEGYGGWTYTHLNGVTSTKNTVSLLNSYMAALLLFTYYGDGDEHPYRAKLMKFIRMDFDDEVDTTNPLPAFEKAFGLDADGWKKLEADFLAWQKS